MDLHHCNDIMTFAELHLKLIPYCQVVESLIVSELGLLLAHIFAVCGCDRRVVYTDVVRTLVGASD